MMKCDSKTLFGSMLLLLLLTSFVEVSNAFSLIQSSSSSSLLMSSSSSSCVESSTTTTAPPREETQRKEKRKKRDEKNEEDDIRRYKDDGSPLEYYEDEFATRDPEDPFHILLLDKTFDQNERITVKYVTNSVSYVCDIPEQDAFELTSMAAMNGMSCLGTWKRETCLSLGKKLQNMDIVCRVVPYCPGGSRPWQAKRGDMGSSSSSPDDYIDVGNGFN